MRNPFQPAKETDEETRPDGRCQGQGTPENPYVVEFLHQDPRNPMNFPVWRKWMITSSAYSASAGQITKELHASSELFQAGVALFVLGFAIGPALWAPLSELYGRQTVVRRITSDQCWRGHRGLVPHISAWFASQILATAPFMGPILGPIIGGFVTITVGWRWVQGVCCIFIGVVWIIGIVLLPETYGPVLLRRRARHLSRRTGRRYISVLEKSQAGVRVQELFAKTVKRPNTGGWNPGVGSLPFLGLAVGMLLGLVYTIVDDKRRYQKLGYKATPESRLPPAMVGAVALPVGMFAFAWTNSPSIHWSASVILSAPFGFGTVLVFIAILVYLLDAYTIYAASVLAASAMLRAFVGAAFPLFTTAMFNNLGIHWASSIPAFLTVACLPFPFVMYRFGAKVRMKCKYAHEAALLMAHMQAKSSNASQEEPKDEETAD
ncbi:uncharacterized protein CDV56_108231 [Aspergillus thermomutatus]|uniref:Major facilitator superfamily (MFS) profile domain-containing protein n=1 Tax=Aspergillus thermomutatus TaxID=41047 RepID=A0A397HP28_ASPTH|nr:uncharacterized protein CDV56_108231 [Aspergillus thermomutatus]RHZ64935.1 hypothetical protein CDV56_108231 [Aspergillus thermomutatus]